MREQILSIDEDSFLLPLPIGNRKAVFQGDFLVSLSMTKDSAGDNPLSDSRARQLFTERHEYLRGERKVFDIPYRLKGTAFQRKVWKQIEKIPYGETRTYKDIAFLVSSPKVSRAVGMACNRNPIRIIVPCHRVIGSNKKLTGYAFGVERKKSLLSLEQGR